MKDNYLRAKRTIKKAIKDLLVRELALGILEYIVIEESKEGVHKTVLEEKINEGAPKYALIYSTDTCMISSGYEDEDRKKAFSFLHYLGFIKGDEESGYNSTL